MSNIAILCLVLGTLLAAAIVAIVILAKKVKRRNREASEFSRRESELYADLSAEFAQQAEEIRSDARKRSRTVHMASISEQLAPLLPEFRYSHKDVQWVGGAIDAIVWDGLESGGDVEIVFLDVKTGPHANLNPRQRRIREAIFSKRVKFDVYSPPETPLLTEAPHLPELPGHQAVSSPEDQAADEPGQQPRAFEAIAGDTADVPAPFIGELLAGEERPSQAT